MHRHRAPLLIAAVALAMLPFVLDRLGLPLRTSIDVVVFAIACLGLNVLVGYTGLVSFGHGAWFGLAAYAAARGLLLTFDPRLNRASLCHCLPVDRLHGRRERPGRRHARERARPQSR